MSAPVDDKGENREERLERLIHLQASVANERRWLKEHGMPCILCPNERTCQCVYDSYNFDTEAMVDCLAAK